MIIWLIQRAERALARVIPSSNLFAAALKHPIVLAITSRMLQLWENAMECLLPGSKISSTTITTGQLDLEFAPNTERDPKGKTESKTSQQPNENGDANKPSKTSVSDAQALSQQILANGFQLEDSVLEALLQPNRRLSIFWGKYLVSLAPSSIQNEIDILDQSIRLKAYEQTLHRTIYDRYV